MEIDATVIYLSFSVSVSVSGVEISLFGELGSAKRGCAHLLLHFLSYAQGLRWR